MRLENSKALSAEATPEDKAEAVKAIQASLTDGQQHMLGLSTKMESLKDNKWTRSFPETN